MDTRKTTPGASYPMRELAELARQSSTAWKSWADRPGLRRITIYHAEQLIMLNKVMSYVLDQMADNEEPGDGPPPAAARISLQSKG